MDYEFEKDHSFCNSPLFKMDNEKESDCNLFFNDSSDDFHSNFKLAFNNDQLANNNHLFKTNDNEYNHYNQNRHVYESKHTLSTPTVLETNHNTPLITK